MIPPICGPFGRTEFIGIERKLEAIKIREMLVTVGIRKPITRQFKRRRQIEFMAEQSDFG